MKRQKIKSVYYVRDVTSVTEKKPQSSNKHINQTPGTQGRAAQTIDRGHRTAYLLVHGILGATEDQYDAVMHVELDDMKLYLDSNFRGPVNPVDDPDRVIDALVRHAKKKLKDLIRRRVQQVVFRVNMLLYHNEPDDKRWPDGYDMPDDVLEDESIVDYFVRVHVLPRINEAFEEMTNALDREFNVTQYVYDDVARLRVRLSLRPEPLPVVRQDTTTNSSCLEGYREVPTCPLSLETVRMGESIACLPCGHWMSLDEFQRFARI